MINILSILLFIIFNNLYFFNILKYYQEDHYHFRLFKRLIFKYYFKRPYFIIIIFLILLNNHLVTQVVISFILICLIIEYHKQKLIKLTKRILRLIIINSLFCLFIIINKYNIFIITIILLIYPLYLMLLFYIETNITKVINQYYYNKAKKKIKKYKPFIIGITGSCGKTSIKNYLYNTLNKEIIAFKSDKSYNTLNGLSMTINQKLNSYNTVFILEMGASHKKDIKKITKYFKPNISIISEILPQHLETFKTMDTLVNEKMEIIKNMCDNGLIIVNGDNKLIIDNLINPHNNPIYTFGMKHTNDFYPENIQIEKNGLKFNVKDLEINSELIGRHNINNLLVVIIVLKYFKIPNFKIKKYIEELKNYENRLETKVIDDLIILNDSYNSNYIGFINALEILSKYQGTKMIITPGIVEGGIMQAEINRNIASEICKKCDFCYLVNNKNTEYFEEEFQKNNFNNYIVVKSFTSGFNQAKNKKGILLIENDLTDYYYLDIKRRNKE